MDQVTQPVAPTAPASTPIAPTDPERSGFEHALAVAGRIAARLTALPRSVEVDRDVITRAHQIRMFCSHDTAPVLEFAAIADVPVQKSANESRRGWFVEARARVENVDVWVWALLSNAQFQKFNEQEAPPAVPVALGSSVLAHVPPASPAPVGEQ